MTLQASGQIKASEINVEVRNGSTDEASFSAMTALAIGDSTITNEPDNVSDWYSYTHYDAPTNFTANWDGVAEDMTLGWDDNQSTEDGFRIEYQLDSGGGFGAWIFLIDAAANATSYIKKYTCNNSNTYHYRIRWEVTSPAYESDWSATSGDRTTICPL
jgi:hypothetical protein